MTVLLILAGAAFALAARALLVRLLVAKFRRDVARLNAGDPRPLLAAFADDAVLHFNEGDHRWSGVHRGRAAIDTFFREFCAAGIEGEIGDVWISGPPWALRIAARFDDWAIGPDGERIYSNRTCLVLRTRFGKIVEQTDFYEDTERIADLERSLVALGMPPRGWERAAPTADSRGASAAR